MTGYESESERKEEKERKKKSNIECVSTPFIQARSAVLDIVLTTHAK
jgi:hypothetical protein